MGYSHFSRHPLQVNELIKDLGAGNAGGSVLHKASKAGAGGGDVEHSLATESIAHRDAAMAAKGGSGGGFPGSILGGQVALVFRVVLALGVMYIGWGMGRIANAILQLNSTLSASSGRSCGSPP